MTEKYKGFINPGWERCINLDTNTPKIVDIYSSSADGGLHILTEDSNNEYIIAYDGIDYESFDIIINHIETLEYEKAMWVKKYHMLKTELKHAVKELEELRKLQER